MTWLDRCYDIIECHPVDIFCNVQYFITGPTLVWWKRFRAPNGRSGPNVNTGSTERFAAKRRKLISFRLLTDTGRRMRGGGGWYQTGQRLDLHTTQCPCPFGFISLLIITFCFSSTYSSTHREDVNCSNKILILFFFIRLIRYECCEGYNRVPGQEGCAGGKSRYLCRFDYRNLNIWNLVDS